ncbi:MAG TPA: thiamine pyrophosphate-dependent enzyme, partial [Thermoplasmata archaeon]|nr:thiamine pyrophosphate-dependent enzyme [Thermoplasmata archaeon]
GDGYAIGMGHFMHAFKKNASFLYIVMNNETYGLTKGQASPTSQVGFEGNVENPFDAILTALSIPAPNFIARTFSGDPKQMTQILVEGLKFNRENRGFAFVEALSPCVTYNDTYKEWRAKVVDVSKLPGYDPTDRSKTFELCLKTMDEGKIPIGVMHRPRSASSEAQSLELKLLPDRTGPAVAEIGMAPNRVAYEKLLRALA